MLNIKIDGQEISVPEGTTLLDAARQLGIQVPTLCFLENDCSFAKNDVTAEKNNDFIEQNDDLLGSSDSAENQNSIENRCSTKSSDPAFSLVSLQENVKKSTSCLVCLMKVDGRMLPSCATKVREGMVVESETEEVRALRKTALELLLSDHAGDCFAPCQFACPARMDIPTMLRQIQNRDFQGAVRTVRERIAFPASLGRVCSKPCEKFCRRGKIDESVSICQLKRFVADTDLGSDCPEIPHPLNVTEREIAIIGGGISGLSAAYYLSLKGHNVSIFEKTNMFGGRFRQFSDDILPKEVLDTELEHIFSLPIGLSLETEVDWTDPEVRGELLHSFDAVILATGSDLPENWEHSDFKKSPKGIQTDSKTFETSQPGFFAIGTLFRQKALPVRSAADGREVADVVDSFLSEGKVLAPESLYSVRMKKIEEDELSELSQNGQNADRYDPNDVGINDYNIEEAVLQSSRCLHCDCRGRDKCRLLQYARFYNAKSDSFVDPERHPLQIIRDENIIFEPGKCIRCGNCVELTKMFNEEWGMTLLGRGFHVIPGVPFLGKELGKAFVKTAKLCAEKCPTGALIFIEKNEQ